MAKDVKRRAYHSPRRAAAAAATRQAILAVARSEFLRRGYTATTIAGIARAANVAVDTVYASVGRKPALFRELIETSIAGPDPLVPVAEDEDVRQIRAAATGSDKIEIYASTTAAIHQRLAPLFLALREAATAHPELGQLWSQVADLRARDMHALATDLAATGELRAGLTLDEVADVLWSMNAAEYYILLVHDRGWSPQRFGQWLAEAWRRLLLNPSGPRAPAGGMPTETVRAQHDQR
ncbi:MAG: TetR family transcriptional regulator [Propionibacteriales bacterium]|nr:TetR family transcriptional regulator [Propionibacteriales bacterium]